MTWILLLRIVWRHLALRLVAALLVACVLLLLVPVARLPCLGVLVHMRLLLLLLFWGPLLRIVPILVALRLCVAVLTLQAPLSLCWARPCQSALDRACTW